MKTHLDYTYTLKERVSQFGCEAVARQLGLTRAAVRQMLNAERQIFVKKIRGRWCYAEIRPYKHARAFIRARKVRARSWRPGGSLGRLIHKAKPGAQDTPKVAA